MTRFARPMLYLGIAATVLGVSRVHARYIGRYDFTASDRFAWAGVYILVLCAAVYGFGLPDAARARRDQVIGSILASLTSAMSISVLQLFVGDRLLPRFVVLGAAALVVPLALVAAHLATAGASVARDRVVLVASESVRADLERELARVPEKPAEIVRTLSAAEASKLDSKPLTEAVVLGRASVVVLDADALLEDVIVTQAAGLHESGVRVRTVPLFYEEWLGKVPVHDLARSSLFFDIGELHRNRYGRLKRLVDIVAGVCGCVFLAPVIPVVFVANLFANRGPLFFAQDRVGRNGQAFRMLKFRSMVESPMQSSDWTATDDPRVTRFGRVLRTSHLDELPQVINILRGDLSIVGPRPEQPRYVDELVQQIPFYDLRHTVRPGLTGWAQVKFGYAAAAEDTVEKLQYDFHYLRRQSLVFDLRIIGRTLRAVLGREGR